MLEEPSQTDETSKTWLYILEGLNCILILAHCVILWILTKNTIKYLKQFGKQKDPYTVATLFLLSASTISLLLWLPWIIISMINTQESLDWQKDNVILLGIMTQLPSILANGFFSIALAVNSTKWAKLIVSIKF